MLKMTKTLDLEAALLVVDFEEKYFQMTHYTDKTLDWEGEQWHYFHDEGFQNLLQSKTKLENGILEASKLGLKIFETSESGILPTVKNRIKKSFPYWYVNDPSTGYFGYQVHGDIISGLKNEKKVLVCGLWKELCVCEVTTKLIECGINAVMLDIPEYTIGLDVIHESCISIKEHCENWGIEIIK